MKRIFAVQETTYVNEWLGMLPDCRITALFFRENRKLLSIRSYTSYPEGHVKKLFLPLALRGRKVASVSPLDHIIYTAACFLLLPLILLHEAVIFVVPTFFTAAIMPVLKLFGKKIYMISLDPQDALYETYMKRKTPQLWLYWNVSRFLEKTAARSATKIFTVSNYLKQQYSVYNSSVFVTPNGADLRRIAGASPRRLSKDFTIAYFGSLDGWRGVDMLADAFVAARKVSKRHMKLLLLGGGPEEENLRKRFAGDKDVYISGYIDHASAIALCKGSDVLVAPFRETPVLRRTFSIKPAEYIACGIPVVVTDTGEHAELVRNLKAGIVASPDAESIAEAIERLMKDKKLYKRLRENCERNRDRADYRVMRRAFVDEVS